MTNGLCPCPIRPGHEARHPDRSRHAFPWLAEEDWQLHEAALHGSSHYVMPSVLQWFTANIGIHHVHHLYCRIPFYRLPEVLRDHSELAQSGRMTIRESLTSARLHLWDEETRTLISFSKARALYL